MLTTQKTQLVMEQFFNDCLKFWYKKGYDERKAFEMALNDTKNITTDPYSPFGDKLHEETRIKFIQYREIDLGKEK